jgi:hypothetical protein
MPSGNPVPSQITHDIPEEVRDFFGAEYHNKSCVDYSAQADDYDVCITAAIADEFRHRYNCSLPFLKPEVSTFPGTWLRKKFKIIFEIASGILKMVAVGQRGGAKT